MTNPNMKEYEMVNILIVDDREENLYALEETLKRDDRRVITANSGSEALRVILDQEIALILMDVQMPEMDGFEVADLLKSNEDTKEIPIIFITAISGEHEHVQRGFATGAVDYIFKPIDSHPLRSKVDVFIEIYRSKKALEKEVEIRKEAQKDLQKAHDLLEDKVKERTRELTETNQLLRKEIVERRKAEETARTASEAKSQFLANMSHEIRTPMNGIFGMIDIVLGTEVTDEQQDCLEVAQSSAQSLLRIINDVLDFSKIEAQRLKLDPLPFYLRREIEKTVQMIEPLAEKKLLEVAVQISEDTPDRLIGDVTRLRQILINLLGNAIKFTDEGIILLEVVQDNDQPDGEIANLHFAVTDTGIGIPQQYQKHIFDLFTQADGSTTRRHSGTGLGLAICSGLIELMNGKIWVESEANQGSTFHFVVPLNINTAPEDQEIESATTPDQDQIPLMILLVEDDTVNQIIISKVLSERHEIDVASNGKIALEMIEKKNYDLVFMDVQMPEMNGFEATTVIRDRESGTDNHIPIVAMTAHAMKGDREMCIQVGMDGYISKPINRQKIFDAIHTFARQR